MNIQLALKCLFLLLLIIRPLMFANLNINLKQLRTQNFLHNQLTKKYKLGFVHF
jgi:hypothetical protein